MSAIALVPARSGSKGVPGKNFRKLGDRSLVGHAAMCAQAAGCRVVVSSDRLIEYAVNTTHGALTTHDPQPFLRPSELAQDDTPMIDVVKHALAQIPGPSDQIIVLLQPTQPFRQPCHIQAAIALLQESGADSVVSVVELPRTHSPDMVCAMHGGKLWPHAFIDEMCRNENHGLPLNESGWKWLAPRRQDATPVFMRDGTYYVFKRATVERYGTIYGVDCRPLLMAPEDTCELDTEADWAEVERRWKERHG